MTLNPEKAEFSRNLGFISESEQRRLNESVVAVAGAGGDGGMLAVQMARLGVGELRLADPDPFEAENINRQACCTQETVGINKAEAVGHYITSINPGIKVDLYTDGVTESNVDRFVDGADLLIDETEFTVHSVGVMLARAARQRNIPNLMAMNIGFGTTVTSFHPRGASFEKILGLNELASLDEIASQEVSLSRWLPYIPPYVDIEVFKQVASGEKSAPSVAPGVAVAAGTAAVQAFLHLVSDENNNRPAPVYAPKIRMIDTYTGESKLIKHPRISYYKYLGKALINNRLGRHPRASY